MLKPSAKVVLFFENTKFSYEKCIFICIYAKKVVILQRKICGAGYKRRIISDLTNKARQI